MSCLDCVEPTAADPAKEVVSAAHVAHPADGTALTDTAVATGAMVAPAGETMVPVEVPPIDPGLPGASARQEFERRQAIREQRIEETWGSGRFGRIAKAFSDDPQSTKAWKEGADGEERVARALHDGLGDEAVILHDRRVPRSRANIDHLVIARSGVWIVDAKKYKGKVEKRDVGGWFSTDIRLYVGGRDRTKLVAGLEWQVTAVREALGDDVDAPVQAALSFVGAEWPLFFAKPLRIDGVWIGWPNKLAELIARADEQLSVDRMTEIGRLLSERLPAK